MSLPRLFTRLYGEAATTGRPAVVRLQQGATVKVRVANRKHQVILGRRGVAVGEVEEATFRRDGRIPESAARVAYDPTPDGWHYVAYTWEEPPGLFDDDTPQPATPWQNDAGRKDHR